MNPKYKQCLDDAAKEAGCDGHELGIHALQINFIRTDPKVTQRTAELYAERFVEWCGKSDWYKEPTEPNMYGNYSTDEAITTSELRRRWEDE